MTTLGSASRRIRFDGFEADLHTGELRRSGRKLRLPNQSFQVLAMLLDKAGQLVTREELRARLWPSGTFVEYDQSLNAAVNRLREALHDSADRPRYVETLPKRGYRFIGTVESDVAGDPHAANAGVGGGGDAEARAGAGGHRRGKVEGEPRGKAGGDLHGKAGGDSRGEAGGDSRGRAGGEPRVGTLAGDWKPSPESREGVASEGAVASERAVASEGAVAPEGAVASADEVASAGGVAFERAVASEGAVAPAPAVAPGGLVVAAGVLVAGDPVVPESPSSGARPTSTATGLISGHWAPAAAGAAPGPALPDRAGLRVGQLATGRRFGTRRMGLVLFGLVAAVVLVAGATFMLGRRSVAVSDLPPHREVVPFTSLPGQEVAPTFSPDGSHIAFAWNGETGDDRLFDLYVKEIGSERLLRLTRSAAKAMVPAWSPDGGAIAFVRWTENNAAIFVIPALGGPERLVVSRQVAVGHLIRISWSPDGKRIAYPAYGHTGSQRIYLVSLDTLQSEPLAPTPECLDVLEPAFSPDGTQLAVVCTASWGVYTIYTVGLADGSLRRLTSMIGDPQGLAWSADGRRLIFSNDIGRGGELWEVTLEGQLSQLPFGEDGSAPAVAATGSHIAYVRGRNITDIWRIDLTAEHPEESATKLIYSTRAQRNPRYSSDGAHIAFQSNRSGSTEIWLTDGSGADPLRLTSFNGPFTDMPSWCSDGRRIAFDSSASGAPAIYIEDINERTPRRLATSQTNLSRPGWSQDCRWLFAGDDGFPHRAAGGSSSTPTLYKLPVSGGPAEVVTRRPAYYPIGLPDRVLFGVMEAAGVSLWYKPAGDGPEARVEGMPRLSYSDAWTANANGVFYTDISTQPVSVKFYDFATHAIRRVVSLHDAPIPGGGFGIAVTADGHWLLYTQVDDLQSDIMLGSSS